METTTLEQIIDWLKYHQYLGFTLAQCIEVLEKEELPKQSKMSA